MTLSDIEVQDLPAQATAVVQHRVTLQDMDRIPGWLGETYEAVQRSGVEPAGMPFLRTLAMDEDGMEIEVGWPVPAPFAGDGDVHASSLPDGPAAVVSYFGPFDGVAGAYEALGAWCGQHGREVAGPPWETYYTDPEQEPDQSKWRTDVHFPLRG
ncbi:MAG: GyrI-like domain-containing protein [Dehalococcoidia bacterium]